MFFPVREEKSSAEESGVAACVVPVTASYRQSGFEQHCSQTGLHGDERERLTAAVSQTLTNLLQR